MATLAKLFVELGFDPSKFNKGIDQAESKTRSMAASFRKVGLGMTAAFTAPAIAVGKQLLDIGMAYDAMSDTIAVGTGATGKDLEALNQTALNVFKAIPTTMEAVGPALTLIQQRTGDTGKALEDLTKTELELARITGTDVNSVIGSTTELFNQWEVSTADQVGTLDKLFRASQATGVPVDTLAQQLTQYGPILRQMGFGLDESTALLATLGKSGLDAGTVVTGLRTAFKKFADEGLTDTNAALTDVFTQIQNAPDDLAAGQIAIDTFGSRAGPALAESIRTGKLSYEDLLTAIETGDTTILGTADSTNDLAEKWQIFKNQLTIAVLPAATKLFDLLNKTGIPFLTKMAAKIQTLVTWFSKLPGPVKSAALGLGLVLAALGPILVVIGTLLPAISAFGAAFGVLLGPVGLVILAVVLLAVAWKKNLFDIQGKTKAAISFIGSWLSKLLAFIQPAIEVIQLLGTYFHDVMTNKIQPGNLAKLPGWLQPIALILGRVVKSVRVFIVTWQKFGALAAFKTIPAQLQAFGRAMSKLLNAAGLRNFAKAYTVYFNQIATVVGDVINLVDDLVHGRWKQAWSDLKTIATDYLKLLWTAIKAYGALFKDLGRLIGEAFGAINWGALGKLLLTGLKIAFMNSFMLIPRLLLAIAKRINWGDLLSGAADLASQLVGKLGDLAAAIGNWIVGAIPSADEWLGLISTAYDIAGDVISKIGDLAGKVVSWISDAAPSADRWLDLISTAYDIAGDVVGKLGDLGQKVIDWITAAAPGTDDWLGIAANVADIAGAVVGKFGDLSSAVTGWMSTVNWSSIFAPISGAFGSVGDAITGVGTAISDAWDIVDPTVGYIQDALSGIWTFVSEPLGQLLDAIKGIGDAAQGAWDIIQKLPFVGGGGGSGPSVSDPGTMQTIWNNAVGPDSPAFVQPPLATPDVSGIVGAAGSLATAQGNIATALLAIRTDLGLTQTSITDFADACLTGFGDASTNADTKLDAMDTRIGQWVLSLGLFAKAAVDAFKANLDDGLSKAVASHDVFMDAIETRAGLNVKSMAAFGTAAGSQFNTNLSTELGKAAASNNAFLSVMEARAGQFVGRMAGMASSAGYGFANILSNGLYSAQGAMYNAGTAIMYSLYNGLAAVFYNTILPFLNYVSWMIQQNKGPLEKDRIMLKPAGEAIMGGLIQSMRNAIPELHRTIGDVNSTIAGAGGSPRLAPMPALAGTGTNGRSGAGDLHLTVKVDGNVYGVDDLTVAVAKKMGPALVETFRDVRRARGMAT